MNDPRDLHTNTTGCPLNDVTFHDVTTANDVTLYDVTTANDVTLYDVTTANDVTFYDVTTANDVTHTQNSEYRDKHDPYYTARDGQISRLTKTYVFARI